ncbi:hypothetical protein LRAMOSA02899 [Lichtheimia ramosa]|uniref:Aerobactin siderophore biosynthesis IucA/IucC N-terminal domain-containing protein n=1 Tax=Lichtheimia ramosa TaxID=688394 RepID=A0A077WT17_9FUNG|nr:hypothetical protein LRAMOSA02899 [Lichtheimia ramosa]
MVSSHSAEKNRHYGKFATTSRLISCMVTEGLVTAHFVPYTRSSDAIVGLCLILRQNKELLVAVPLRGLPELHTEQTTELNGIQCPKVELVDPWDMLPYIYAPKTQERQGNAPSPWLMDAADVLATVTEIFKDVDVHVDTLVDDYDAVELWNQFAQDYGVDNKELIQVLSEELASSMNHQTYTYDHPKPLPDLQSTAIHWEQSIVEGHATHPMHKARLSYPPLPSVEPGQVNLEHPSLRLVSIPSSSVKLRGDFEDLIRPMVDAMLAKTGASRSQYDVLVPVHEFQIPNIQQRFDNVVVLPPENNAPAEALTSIRSVAVPGLLDNLSLKLCIGIKVSSALRIVSPFSTHFGPGFSANVVPRLSYDRNVLTIQRELASAIYRHDDPHMAKHCSCVVREAPESEEDIDIVAAALVEKIQQPDTDETLVKHVWKLDTEEKRIAFMDRYIQTALQAFVPPLINNGVAFEAHGQNTMVRFNRKTGELKGFVIRDFGGIKAHNETLKKTCGVELDVLPDSTVVAETMEECYKLLYHTLFHSQFHRLIRVLDLHHNGRGWELVRKRFKQVVPEDDPMYTYFMEQRKVPGKCLMRMKLNELYRDYIYEPLPNMILSQPHSMP